MRKAMAVAIALLTACAQSTGPSSSSSAQSEPVSTTVELTTTSSTSTTSSNTPEDATMTVIVEEPYRVPEEGDTSTVDIYMPEGSTPRPAVVLLHGWGPDWTSSPDIDLAALAEEIAQQGATVFYFGWDTNGGYSAESAADLSCIGGFVSARAAEYGANPSSVLVVGHSMGGESGSMLAFGSFDPAPAPGCVETVDGPTPYAVVGIGGAYGFVAEPLDDSFSRFATRAQPVNPVRELAADEYINPGLTALQAYELSGYSRLPAGHELEVVLLVGSDDPYDVTDVGVTEAYARAINDAGMAVEVVIVSDGDHDNVVDPSTDAGQATLAVIRDLLTRAP